MSKDYLYIDISVLYTDKQVISSVLCKDEKMEFQSVSHKHSILSVRMAERQKSSDFNELNVQQVFCM